MESVREQGRDAQRARWPVSWAVAAALERILHVEAVYLWFYMSVQSELERVDARAKDAPNVPLSREDAARLAQSSGVRGLEPERPAASHRRPALVPRRRAVPAAGLRRQ